MYEAANSHCICMSHQSALHVQTLEVYMVVSQFKGLVFTTFSVSFRSEILYKG